MGGSFGTPTARPEDGGGGAAAGIGGVCASGAGASPASAGSIRITSMANILRSI